MHPRLPLILLAILIPALTYSQKPAIDQAVIDQWKTIQNPQISNDGNWATYQLKPNDGDPSLVVNNLNQRKEQIFPRSKSAKISADNRYIAFITTPHRDSLNALKRSGVKKDELPEDTLGILNLATGDLYQTPDVKNHLLSQKWEGWMAYQLNPAPKDTAIADSIKIKKESKTNGSKLIIRNLRTAQEDTIGYVDAYKAAEEGPRFILSSTGDDSTFQAGVYLYDCPAATLTPLLQGEGKYQQITLNEAGTRAAFLAFRDTLIPDAVPYGLYYWQDGMKEARLIADSTLALLPDQWLLSEHFNLSFSEDFSKLSFGIAPPPIIKDTTLLKEDIVNVEVWTYTDARLYTHEEARLEEEKKKAYTCIYHIDEDRIVQLGSPAIPKVVLGDEGNAKYALGYDDTPYLQLVSWEGFPYCRDIYLIDTENGKAELIKKKVCGNPNISPKGKYLYWYSSPDSSWFAYSIPQKKLQALATKLDVAFYDELNDRPMHPSPYGIAGWTTDDDFIMIYDRYDIWLVDPLNNLAHNNLTKGRAQKTTYRYIKLDPEQRSIEEVEPMLLHTFDEGDKSAGYVWFNIHTGIKEQVQEGAYSYTKRVIKAKDANKYLFTRESFIQFPDLLFSSDNLSTYKQISIANPQQEQYRWGTAEPYSWVGADGQLMEGILIKPEGFDPQQKYPAITYFYERYADRLHSHWTPRYPRSIINFPYYASRGYVIFIPDIHYRVGYPGESALDAVTTGVTSLLEKGFVDKERLGVQGHSWGGYQVAYLITQTNLFKCAESGAPVVNMTSAYGGIRWKSGLSRMFQYEHTQSRIGGTLWDKPLRYIENSPLFFADKIETPVLILHNDDDGAVPWYQGIEFFVALRRLGKASWLLNYNDEPHGVMEEQNRRDFQQRMQQFFDYYLLDAPKPAWMDKGVPPVKKGVEQGLQPTD
jgi:dipeptidyl aminopeptidase/acylaminoacyl peptidase